MHAITVRHLSCWLLTNYFPPTGQNTHVKTKLHAFKSCLIAVVKIVYDFKVSIQILFSKHTKCSSIWFASKPVVFWNFVVFVTGDWLMLEGQSATRRDVSYVAVVHSTSSACRSRPAGTRCRKNVRWVADIEREPDGVIKVALWFGYGGCWDTIDVINWFIISLNVVNSVACSKPLNATCASSGICEAHSVSITM